MSKILRWNSFAFYWGRPQQPLRSLLLDVPLHVRTNGMCVRLKTSLLPQKHATPPHSTSTVCRCLWPTVFPTRDNCFHLVCEGEPFNIIFIFNILLVWIQRGEAPVNRQVQKHQRLWVKSVCGFNCYTFLLFLIYSLIISLRGSFHVAESLITSGMCPLFNSIHYCWSCLLKNQHVTVKWSQEICETWLIRIPGCAQTVISKKWSKCGGYCTVCVCGGGGVNLTMVLTE